MALRRDGERKGLDVNRAPQFHDGLDRFRDLVKDLSPGNKILAEAVLVGALSVAASKDAWDSSIDRVRRWIDRQQEVSQ